MTSLEADQWLTDTNTAAGLAFIPRPRTEALCDLPIPIL